MEVPTFEAKNRLSAPLAEGAQGIEVIFAKCGVPGAKLVPVTRSFDREKARQAGAGLQEASRGATLGGLKIKDLVNEGRC
jgi:antitoxin (DNA-binding transcriptional repressor) of toxin-antitoxin stability system